MDIEFELPRGAEREYLIVFGVAAIYIATAPSGEPAIVGASRDLERTQRAIQAKWPSFEITAAFWVRDRHAAEKIASAVNANLRHNTDGRLTARGETAARLIETVAAEREIVLTRHEAAMERVHVAVERVATQISESNASGELAWFNVAYREWRLEATKFGLGMSYAEALARLRKEVTKRLIRLNKLDLREDLLPNIFPALPQHRRKKFR